ncbi:MAG: CvpA family protein [Oscillospiraceae bacterium]|nr:CvpA family protein [Oscillospiraceae bacterium]
MDVFGIVTDIFVVLILVFVSWLGVRKGLFHSILDFIYSLLSLLFAILIYPFITRFIAGTDWFADAERSFAHYMLTKPDGGAQNAISGVGAAIETVELPTLFRENTITDAAQRALDAGIEVAAFVASHRTLVVVIAFFAMVLVFFIIRSLLGVLDQFITKVIKQPVLAKANKILGVVPGFLMGCLVVYMIMAFLAIMNLLPEFTGIIAWVNDSKIASFFYNDNIIFKVAGSLAG